jgi:hypothetical protein
MGIFGTFLALGWLGGNLINDSIKQSKLDRSYNEQHKGERIYSYGGKYYDRETGKRVTSRIIKDPVSGLTSTVWVNLYGDDTIVYNEGRHNWKTENDAWKAKIEAEQMKKNPQFLREAEENGLRFAKYILPYRPGIRIVQEGYIDRMEEVKEGKERQYYMGEYHMGKTILRRVQFEHNRWKPANGYCTYIYGMGPAYTTEKYLTKEEVDAKKR